MTPRNYSLLAGSIFALIALLQLARAVSGWPTVVAGNWPVPLWLNWLAFIVMSILAWLGFRAARG
jgi:hypothetical protein